MNIYKALNELTLYIDEHLDEKISYERLAKILGVNSYTMQRLFALLTNITLADYIRKRRLSVAGEELYINNEKIMDIAIKYCYDNATSFSRAFTNFHGIKPSQINKETKLKIFPRIVFDETENIKESISYEIIELEEKIFYGTKIATNNDCIGKDAPRFFCETRRKYQEFATPTYAMTTYDDERIECNAYWVLYEQKVEGLEKVVIPKSKWLVFRINSQEPEDIQSVTNGFYLDILPSCKYNLSNLPELEYYHDDITDFLVSII